MPSSKRVDYALLKSELQHLVSSPSEVRRVLASARPEDWDTCISDLAERLNCPAIRGTTTFDYDRCYSYKILLHPSMDEWRQIHLTPEWLMAERGIDAMLRKHISFSQDWLWLHVSILAPYYTYYLQRYPSYQTDKDAYHAVDTSSSVPSPSRQHICFGDMVGYTHEEGIIHSFFDTMGYTLLSDVILRSRVEGVTLELSDPNEVTVLKCLFFDYESPPGETILPTLV